MKQSKLNENENTINLNLWEKSWKEITSLNVCIRKEEKSKINLSPQQLEK